MSTATIRVELVPYAPLLARYDLLSKQHEQVGTREGLYGRESEDGALYVALGAERAGMIFSQKELTHGPFYPATVLVTGEDEHGQSLSFRTLEKVLRLMNRTHSIDRVILPRGYVGGAATWWNGVKSERGREWWYATDPLAALRRGLDVAEVLSSYATSFEILVDGLPGICPVCDGEEPCSHDFDEDARRLDALFSKMGTANIQHENA